MISQRAQSIAPSETLKISAKAKEMIAQGRSVISLSAGEPDFKTPAHICNAAIEAITNGHHGYTANTGLPELRKAIADKLARDNQLDYDPGQIIVSNGAKQSIGFSILATINKGDEVIVPAPYWVSYPEMVKLAEGVPVILRASFDHDYKITAEELEEAITEKTRGLILCSPSNPTGACYSRKELKTLAAVLRNYPDILIYSDEIYEYIVFDSDHVSLLNVAPDLKERTVLVNGFSKGFAMTGWRLGYAAGPSDIIAAISKLQSQETSAPSTISQMAGIAAYEGSLRPVLKMKEAFQERRDYLLSELRSVEGVRCFTPPGAFYLFPDIGAYLRRSTPEGERIETSTDLCEYLLEKWGVAAVPGAAFGEPNGIRLSYASSMKDLEEAASRLRQGLLSLVR